MNTCPVKDCGAEIPSHLIVCPDHWKSIPVAKRRKVYKRRMKTRLALTAALETLGVPLPPLPERG